MNNITDEIKARIDIVDLINGYTPLRKAGRNYKALCPFHNEKTPSFVVFPESGTWRCFGACGEGGDIFSFVMKKEGWDFAEALRVLADRAGVELQPVTPQQEASRDEQERLRSLLADAAHFYHKLLIESPAAKHARTYVEKRGLRRETLDQFQIGFAPDSWDATLYYLGSLGYELDEVSATGMLVVREDGSHYDRFRDRLMIPIRDARGQMAGFGARALSKDANPKYLNSPQSVLFDKSSLLFGLDMSRRSIRDTESAVIVEGYMDVISAHQAGFPNVVAQMGTALTEVQLRLLARYANRLILALDPDAAGQMATDRGREVIERVSKAAAERATEEGVWDFDAAERDYRAKLTAEFDAEGMVRYESRLGFDIRVLLLPEGHDPDDVFRQTPELWPELVSKAVPITEYVIQSLTAGKNLNDPKVKAQVARQIAPLIQEIADPVERSHYRQRLARLLKVDERALFPEGAARGKPSRAPGDHAGQPQHEDRHPVMPAAPTLSREAFCLAALIQHPRLIYKANRVFAEYFDPDQMLRAPLLAGIKALPPIEALAPKVVEGDFAHPEYRNIFLAWEDALSQDEVEPVQHLLQTLDPIIRQHIDLWLKTPLYALLRGVIPPSAQLTDERISEEVIHGLLELRHKRLEEQLQELTFLISDLDNGGSSLTIQAYGDTIRSLTAARTRIEQARDRSSLPNKRDAGRTNRSAPTSKAS